MKHRETKAGVPPHDHRAHIRTRRRLRSAAEKDHPGRPIGWRGGITYFTDTGERVPSSPEIPKPGMKAIGWDGSGAIIWPPVKPEFHGPRSYPRPETSWSRSSTSFGESRPRKPDEPGGPYVGSYSSWWMR